ncbi:PKD domain-containing protein [Kitasatospora cineracea]|uniref:PKD domain-containing protein n=1 Tax=Kitasatospora cineracea TaxID=88074 RepID=UPI00344A589C
MAADSGSSARSAQTSGLHAGVQASKPDFKSAEGTVSASKSAAPMARDSQTQAKPLTAANATLGADLHAVQSSAHGITLDITASSDTWPLSATINWGDGKSTPVSVASAAKVTQTHVYDRLGAYTISVTLTDGSGNTATGSLNLPTAGNAYTAYGPTRLLDTRDGTGAPRAKVPAYGTAKIKIAGNGSIPAGVTAVVLNVTVTNPTTEGHVTVYGEGDARPTTSNLNYLPGQTVPNLVIAPVGANGYVDLYNGGWGSVDLIADVTGYFTQSQASGYTPVDPKRLLDTRNSSKVAAYGTVPVTIPTNAQVPDTKFTAVALNVTVTNPDSDGHLTVYPSGQSLPTASNVNFTAGQTVANSVIVPVGADGRIQVQNGAWKSSDVIVDVVGYYTANSKSAYIPVDPDRLLDTRQSQPLYPYDASFGYDYALLDLGSWDSNITGWALNATVTNTRGDGHLSVSQDTNTLDAYRNGTYTRQAVPNSSALNWKAGQTVPNLVQASVGSTGVVDLWNIAYSKTDLIVDMFGFYSKN